jgi:hypothetical protein
METNLKQNTLSSIILILLLCITITLFVTKGIASTQLPTSSPCPNISDIHSSLLPDGGQRRYDRNLWLVQGSDFIANQQTWRVTIMVNALNDNDALIKARLAITSITNNYTQETSPSSPEHVICQYRSLTQNIPIFVSTCTFDNDGECN